MIINQNPVLPGCAPPRPRRKHGGGGVAKDGMMTVHHVARRRQTGTVADLSLRERQVTELIHEGLENKEIAARLGLTDGTVKLYVAHTLAKLKLPNRVSLAVWFERHRDKHMTDPIRCFWLEDAGKLRRWLRRFHTDCPAAGRFLTGMKEIDSITYPPLTVIGPEAHAVDLPPSAWPTTCDCGHVFTEGDSRDVFVETVYRRADTGEEVLVRNAPVGAMWDAWWMPSRWKGSDGLSIVVRLPDGRDWMVDGVCSNCTRPNDRTHRCWVRHGEPPNLTVDKDGNTCAAGAGSIQTPDWHGFLRGGMLIPCG